MKKETCSHIGPSAKTPKKVQTNLFPHPDLTLNTALKRLAILNYLLKCRFYKAP